MSGKEVPASLGKFLKGFCIVFTDFLHRFTEAGMPDRILNRSQNQGFPIRHDLESGINGSTKKVKNWTLDYQSGAVAMFCQSFYHFCLRVFRLQHCIYQDTPSSSKSQGALCQKIQKFQKQSGRTLPDRSLPKSMDRKSSSMVFRI
nr:MAG TPA: hypothetical protein [Caudoviricetes sp.]